MNSLIDSTVLGETFLNKRGRRIFEDFWVKELRKTSQWAPDKYNTVQLVTQIVTHKKFDEVFDLIEFLDESLSNHAFATEIAEAFVSERLAYRFKDGKVIAVGTEAQAETIATAFNYLETTGMNSASTHLKNASRLLAQADYGGSVRESISAVESVARKLEPSSNTLGEALNKLHKSNPNAMHPALNEAFKKLYGYASSTEGVRHALIDENQAPVNEAEALFMLGVCSAFIPYLDSYSE